MHHARSPVNCLKNSCFQKLILNCNKLGGPIFKDEEKEEINAIQMA
jgi:hypothetical protein